MWILLVEDGPQGRSEQHPASAQSRTSTAGAWGRVCSDYRMYHIPFSEEPCAPYTRCTGGTQPSAPSRTDSVTKLAPPKSSSSHSQWSTWSCKVLTVLAPSLRDGHDGFSSLINIWHWKFLPQICFPEDPTCFSMGAGPQHWKLGSFIGRVCLFFPCSVSWGNWRGGLNSLECLRGRFPSWRLGWRDPLLGGHRTPPKVMPGSSHR
jgi:hypothetical protein